MNTFQKQLQSLRQRQQLLYVLLFTFATILIWVSISLLTSQKKTEISPELQALARPLTPTLNRQVLSEIQAKRVFTADELRNFPIYTLLVSRDGTERVVTIQEAEAIIQSTTATPTPSPTPTPEPSQPASPSATTPASVTAPATVSPAPSPVASPVASPAL